MPTTWVIFSGFNFSYAALDRAIDWAKTHNTGLGVLFLQEKPVEEGYVFPSDIDAAESLAGEADARQDDDQLVRGKIKLIKDKAAEAGIQHVAKISDDPSIKAILPTTTGADKMYVDVGTMMREEAADRLFNAEDLVEKAACPVELVTAD
jgi:hypothetical protein